MAGECFFPLELSFQWMENNWPLLNEPRDIFNLKITLKKCDKSPKKKIRNRLSKRGVLSIGQTASTMTVSCSVFLLFLFFVQPPFLFYNLFFFRHQWKKPDFSEWPVSLSRNKHLCLICICSRKSLPGITLKIPSAFNRFKNVKNRQDLKRKKNGGKNSIKRARVFFWWEKTRI